MSTERKAYRGFFVNETGTYQRKLGRGIFLNETGNAGPSVMPDAGTIAITGPVPTIAQQTDPHLDVTGSITILGPAPTVSYSITLNPITGAITLLGPAPTVVRQVDNTPVNLGSVAITLLGAAPSLDNGIVIGTNVEVYDIIGYLTLIGPPPRVRNQAYNSGGGGFIPNSVGGNYPGIARLYKRLAVMTDGSTKLVIRTGAGIFLI